METIIGLVAANGYHRETWICSGLNRDLHDPSRHTQYYNNICNVQIGKKKRTLLMASARCGNLERVRALTPTEDSISFAGYIIDLRDILGFSAYNYADVYKHTDICRRLIECTASDVRRCVAIRYNLKDLQLSKQSIPYLGYHTGLCCTKNYLIICEPEYHVVGALDFKTGNVIRMGGSFGKSSTAIDFYYEFDAEGDEDVSGEGNLSNSLFDSPKFSTLSNDGAYIFVCENHAIRAIQIRKRITITVLKDISGTPSMLIMDPANANLLYFVEKDTYRIDEIKMYNTSTSELTCLSKSAYDIKGMVISSCGLYLYITSTEFKEIQRMTISTREITTLCGGFTKPCALALHNNYLYVADDNLVRRVDLTTLTVTVVIGSHFDSIKDRPSLRDKSGSYSDLTDSVLALHPLGHFLYINYTYEQFILRLALI